MPVADHHGDGPPDLGPREGASDEFGALGGEEFGLIVKVGFAIDLTFGVIAGFFGLWVDLGSQLLGELGGAGVFRSNIGDGRVPAKFSVGVAAGGCGGFMGKAVALGVF